MVENGMAWGARQMGERGIPLNLISQWSQGQLGRVQAQRQAAALQLRSDDRVVQAGNIGSVFDGAQAIGLDASACFKGQSFDEAYVRRSRARVSWNELVRSLENLEEVGLDPEACGRMGSALAHSKHLFAPTIAGAFMRTQHLFYLGINWLVPMTTPVLLTELTVTGQRMTVVIELPRQFAPSSTYYHLQMAMLRNVSRLIGQPAIEMRGSYTPHRWVYEIVVPPHQHRGLSVGRVLSSISSLRHLGGAARSQARALKQSLRFAELLEEQFRVTLDSLPEAVLVHNEATLRYVNSEGARLLGYSRTEDAVGLFLDDIVLPADRPQLDFSTDDCGELRLLRLDGSVVLVSVSRAQPILFEKEPAQMWIARDISTMRREQEHRAVADRISSIETISAGMAHELNNPLTPALTGIELAQRALGRDATAEARRHLETALEGANRVKSILRDLSSLSRPNEKHTSPVSVDAVTRSTIRLASIRARGSVKIDYHGEATVTVLVNESRLGQVLLNLIINAADAYASTETVERHISVRLSQPNDRVLIEVADQAGGVPETIQSQIFEPFFSTKSFGSGLGLAVARQLVDDMGGELSFESQAGQGSVFRISLPAARPVERRERLAARSTAQKLRRVLIIDDEELLLQTFVAALETSVDEVLTAKSGNAAISLLLSEREVDAILCDVMMPDGTGIEVHRYLLEHRPDLVPRTVFATGGACSPEGRAFLAQIDNTCLKKPFELEELVRALKAAAARR